MLAWFAGPYGAMIVLAQVVVLGWLFHGLFTALQSGAQDSAGLYRAAWSRRPRASKGMLSALVFSAT